MSSLTNLCRVLDPEDFLQFFFFFFLASPSGLRIFVPQPGMEPKPRQWKRWVLTTGPPGNSLSYFFSKSFTVLNLHLSLWSILSKLGFMQFHPTHAGFSIQQQLQIRGDHYADFWSSGSCRHSAQKPLILTITHTASSVRQRLCRVLISH